MVPSLLRTIPFHLHGLCESEASNACPNDEGMSVVGGSGFDSHDYSCNFGQGRFEISEVFCIAC